jgi:hypothetical protein
MKSMLKAPGTKQLKLNMVSCFRSLASILTCASPLWKHRAQSPVMYVQTYRDDNDETAPNVLPFPRRQWETLPDRMNFSTIFDMAGFDAAKQYVICFRLRHPGTETWPSLTIILEFAEDAATMDMRVLRENLVAQALKSAELQGFQPDMRSAVVARSHVRLIGLRGRDLHMSTDLSSTAF